MDHRTASCLFKAVEDALRVLHVTLERLIELGRDAENSALRS
jgi:hypothetical protein